MSHDQLNDKEWAEAQSNHAKLQEAIAKHGPELVKQAIKDGLRPSSKQ